MDHLTRQLIASKIVNDFAGWHEGEAVLKDWLSRNGIAYAENHGIYYAIDRSEGNQGNKLGQFSNFTIFLIFALEHAKKTIEQRVESGKV